MAKDQKYWTKAHPGTLIYDAWCDGVTRGIWAVMDCGLDLAELTMENWGMCVEAALRAEATSMRYSQWEREKFANRLNSCFESAEAWKEYRSGLLVGIEDALATRLIPNFEEFMHENLRYALFVSLDETGEPLLYRFSTSEIERATQYRFRAEAASFLRSGASEALHELQDRVRFRSMVMNLNGEYDTISAAGWCGGQFMAYRRGELCEDNDAYEMERFLVERFTLFEIEETVRQGQLSKGKEMDISERLRLLAKTSIGENVIRDGGMCVASNGTLVDYDDLDIAEASYADEVVKDLMSTGMLPEVVRKLCTRDRDELRVILDMMENGGDQ